MKPIDDRKDIFGRPIEIGNWGVFIAPGSHRSLTYGKVVKITPKNIRLEYAGRMLRWDRATHNYIVTENASHVVPDSDLVIVDESVIFWHKLTEKKDK